MQVPFLDLKSHHAPMLEEINCAIQQVIECGAFAGGPFVAQSEEDFANYNACGHAIGVGSGTEALWLALLASGVGPGDEVITVPSTFMATAEAITYCGARPVFVDVDERTYTMDPAALKNVLTVRTKAIIPVHLFGQPADMDPILEFARRHSLFVIEDACQAHGAEYKGRRAGTLGDAGCFSFYPGKNLGAFGEAGAVVTNNSELDGRIRILRDHGQVRSVLNCVLWRTETSYADLTRRTTIEHWPASKRLSLPLKQFSPVMFITFTRSGFKIGTRSFGSWAIKASAVEFIIPCPCTCKRLTAVWAMGQKTSRSRSAALQSLSHCPCSLS